jgi:DNA-binding transcriptional MerR regulator
MKINEIIMNESLYISYISINYIDLLKHLINIDLHLQDIDALLKLHSQQSKSAASQKSFQFSHEKTKFIAEMKNLKFFASSTQFKDDATLKFSKFKQDAASFNLMC